MTSSEPKGTPVQPDPYRRWRLALFALVVAAAVLYVAYLGLSFLAYLSSLGNR